MPFTPAHAAAALPFGRTRLRMASLVIGTFAPDFPYFLILSPSTGIGHTPLGALTVSLPLALVILWLYEKFVRELAVTLLPSGLSRKLDTIPHSQSFGSTGTVLCAVGSALVGIVTHILWDSVTHNTMWPYRHWGFLRSEIMLPYFGPEACYKLLQYGSSVVGCGILLLWAIHWYRQAPVSHVHSDNIAPNRFHIWLVVLSIALAGSLVHASIGIRSKGHVALAVFGQAVVTFLALLWWGLVAYGICFHIRAPRMKT